MLLLLGLLAAGACCDSVRHHSHPIFHNYFPGECTARPAIHTAPPDYYTAHTPAANLSAAVLLFPSPSWQKFSLEPSSVLTHCSTIHTYIKTLGKASAHPRSTHPAAAAAPPPPPHHHHHQQPDSQSASLSFRSGSSTVTLASS